MRKIVLPIASILLKVNRRANLTGLTKTINDRNTQISPAAKQAATISVKGEESRGLQFHPIIVFRLLFILT